MFDPNYDNLPAGAYQTFVSRPDLMPPLLNVNGSGTPGLVFFTPHDVDIHQPALVIADHNGDIVYVNDRISTAMNFDVQTFNGEQYLTFWNGSVLFWHGNGNYHMMDSTLNIVENVPDAAGISSDPHEFRIINDTALVTFFYPLMMNLTKWGGPADGYVYGSGFQQIDLKSREVLFEWRCTDHVSPDVSLMPLGEGTSNEAGDGTAENAGGRGPWDYFHINSVDVHPIDETFLISARTASSIYKIGRNGTIIWTLGGYGGKAAGHGDFYLGERVNFKWQHNAMWRSNTEISIFDNGASEYNLDEPTSRGLRIVINTSTPGNYTATLIQELINWANPIAKGSGCLQYLSNGNYWVSYGIVPLFAEFSSGGEVISQYQISPTGSHAGSYRAYKRNFTTNPSTIPDIAIEGSIVYMSWNGATEVKQWGVFSGASPSDLFLVGTVAKTGFETNFTFPPPNGASRNFIRVDALDVNGNILKSSNTITGSFLPSVPDDKDSQAPMNV